MRILLQRVSSASVTVGDEKIAEIDGGLLALVCAMEGDSEAQAKSLAEKTAALRIFADGDGKMNKSLIDIGGSCLVVSQFTLAADTRKGRRPSYTNAAQPELAAKLCECYSAALIGLGVPVQTGKFGADMKVELVNDGPVTIWLDTEVA